MYLRLILILFILNIFQFKSYSQEIIQQKRLDNIDRVLSSKDGNYLLIKSGFTFTLVEEKSRIQLGSMEINFGRNDHIGQGKTAFLNDHTFVVNTLGEILLVDVLNEKIDTLNLENKFPEIIENFHVLPGNKNQMLIATKVYPMDKNETIQFLEVNRKGEPKYDDTRNCRLYLFDYVQNKILKSTDIPHSLTTISDDGTNIFAGSFDENVIRIGNDLNYEELFNSGKEPIFNLNHIDGKFVVIPHLEKQVLHELGKGEVRVSDITGKILETIELPMQPYPEEQDDNSFIKVLPSNLVRNILYQENQNALLINYGFNRLLKYNLSSGIKEELKINKKFVNFHNFHSVNSQVLITASNTKTATFNNPSNLAIYDLNLQRDISLFSDADPVVKYNKLKKIYRNNNYFYFGKMDFYGELSVIHPSNQSRPIYLKYPDGFLDIDEKSNLLLVSSNQFIFGELDISKIKKDTLSLRLGYRKDMDDLPTETFHPYLDSRNFKDTELPYGISNIREIEKNIYFITGYNQELQNYFLVLDQEGRILFQRNNLEEAVIWNKDYITSSGKYLALDYKKGKSEFLEIWDWRDNKLVYNTKFNESIYWSYKFDVDEDILWLKIDDENNYSSIHEVDLTHPKPEDRIILNKISTSDFAVDRKRNQIATGNAQGIAILDLSTGKKLWYLRTSDDLKEIRQSKQGFDFGTDRYYYTVDVNDFSYVYFTSFEGDKPIEISSNLFYSGDKDALKNIAFVTNGRGYLPSDYDVYLNRPDLVLQQSGSTNSEYHKLIGQAVEKRTAALPTKDFKSFLEQSPQLVISGRDAIPNYTPAQSEILKFQLMSSSGTSLESYHINVNGVPLHGKEGKKIEENATTFETEVKLKLSKGANTIQFYGTDAKGFISNKEVVNIYADYEETSRIHLILISADSYDDSDFNLNYPVKDARDLAVNLQKRYGRNLVVDSLFNESITLENLNRIKEKLTGISVNDRVILFLSGHGVLDSNLEFRFATPDMDFEQVDSYGITNTQIEEFLLSSPAREKLLLIDACHSGEFDRDDYEKTIVSSENQDVKMYEGRKGAKASNVRPSNSTFELMNQLFTDVSEATGIKVISAAAGNSFALESEKWNNGVFTFSLLSTLEEHQTISTSELKKKTFGKVVRLTNGYQQPTSRGETIEFEFSL